ncbi:MAG: hypothetical protein GEV10_08880 [Streptosporangiales bacterium]|nr:hypothetical protein [Streptosporangiales bacterium]
MTGAPATGRRSTPRPTFDGPAIVRHVETAHHVWGDGDAGFVTDRVYVSSDQLHVLEFQLATGGGFRHSPTNQTVFAGDVVYAVLEGTLVIADPRHGEVERVPAGSAVLFRRDTWHHAFNPGLGTVRVLEFFSPPPSRGTASDYAKLQHPPETVHYRDGRYDGRWPFARAEREAERRLWLVDDTTALLSFAGDRASHLLGTLVDTEYLTVRSGRVEAGHVEDFRPVDDETVLVVTSGRLWVDVHRPDAGDYTVHCLAPGDAAYLPVGCLARVLVRDGDPATYLAGSGRVPDGWRP